MLDGVLVNDGVTDELIVKVRAVMVSSGVGEYVNDLL